MKKSSTGLKLIISLIILVLTTVLFSFGVFNLLETPFEWALVIRYALIGFGLAAYFFILVQFKLTLGAIIFLLGYGFAFFILLSAYREGSAGWGDLIGILSWMFIMLATIVLSLLAELVRVLVRKNKEKKVALAAQTEEPKKEELQE